LGNFEGDKVCCLQLANHEAKDFCLAYKRLMLDSQNSIATKFNFVINDVFWLTFMFTYFNYETFWLRRGYIDIKNV